MSYENYGQKIVWVLSGRCDPGIVLNAGAHVLAGLAASLGARALDILDYPSPITGQVNLISRYPVIVLRAKSPTHLERFQREASEAGLPVNTFLECMRGETAELQQHQTAHAAESQILAVAAFGGTEALAPLTKRFSVLNALPRGDA